ncbi:hypothetical protein OF83DRAFT_1157095 [Amylostereum chailletii]|nr:hypothetical protein OF83DRAFT_1157095 [Amylostereum chailletii]
MSSSFRFTSTSSDGVHHFDVSFFLLLRCGAGGCPADDGRRWADRVLSAFDAGGPGTCRGVLRGKNLSKYNMSLAQAVDTIKVKTSWIEVRLRCLFFLGGVCW